MAKATGRTPNQETAKLISDYAFNETREYDDDNPPHILLAIICSQSAEETIALGHALLCRTDSLADKSYRIGAPDCDPRLYDIALRLGYGPYPP